MKIICIPFAGGSSIVFSKWNKLISKNIEIINIELAGRGRRFHEKCYENVDEAVEDIFDIIQPILNSKEPYAIFGHSMGGLLAFELCYKIKEGNFKLPISVFFSAKSAPQLPPKEEVHLFEEQQFIEKVFSLGGTPEQLLNNRELLDLYLPTIRADYKIVETYKYQEKSTLLDVPLYIFYGDKDDIETYELEGWQTYTNKDCRWYEFIGGHFFIQTQEKRVVSLVEDIVVSHLEKS